MFKVILFVCTLALANALPAAFDGFIKIDTPSKFKSTAGSVYYFSTSSAAWGDARLHCRQTMNGELVSLEDLQENDYIVDFMIQRGFNNVWTSGAYDPSAARWKWSSTNQLIGFNAWRPGQPRYSSSSYRVMMYATLFDSGWEAVLVSASYPYICEVRDA